MSVQKVSIQFLILVFSIFTLSACGGKSTKSDEPVTEAETRKCDKKGDKEKCDKGDKEKCDKRDKEKCDKSRKASCEGKCGTEGCEGKCDGGKCGGKCKKGEPSSSPESAASTLPNDGTRVVGDVTKCPVSGNAFTVAADSPKSEIDGKTYYFCCAGCIDKFNAEPAKFL